MSAWELGVFPLFRTPLQAKVLADLFLDSPRTVSQLAARHGVSRQSVSRLLRSLKSFGIVKDTEGTVGVEINLQGPFFEELRTITLKSVAVPMVIGEELSEVPGVTRAAIFGSWAARFAGQQGLPPQDVDVAVIGSGLTPANTAVAASKASERIGWEVNFVPGTEEQWQAEGGFFASIRARPLVPVEVDAPPARRRRQGRRDFSADFAELLKNNDS